MYYMYKQHNYYPYKRFVLVFLSFGVINSHSCNKSKRVIMIREKKHDSKIPAISALH